ncbi:MAG: apolipoprotein N-acyltransferase [Alphaproteobacteria bacterium RIFCSPHIGHO2_01_FULL_41_14]|nr:MAG: apolipoprotein N-acyltransferase [Alphaproteobacteria bacterium GWB1_45_5]OFW76000.1 MAG: apolipoprotein N-acyltransferase [Alphaproteobacteria bacterium GWA1_45_9]OFW89312.1 MAG: apolipoprotein N-acyltransferase [Alphaproteobacteria bacterium RIFCSPHIGHO2_01_FULL_41_14]HCI48236.1 apolipoprotein N-acyltransferase [Holosporales bacterium]
MSSWIRLGLSSREAYLNFFRRFPPLVEFLCLGTLTGLILFPLPGIQVVLLFTVSRLLCLLDVPVHWTHFLTRVWAFGFGFFCISLYWICQALFIEFNVFWWMIPLCFMGLPAFLALFMAFISFWFLGWAYTVPSKILQFLFLQFGYVHSKSVSRLIMAAFWWVSGEYFLTYFLTGLPWSLIGYTWSPVLIVAQTASIGSVYTLSFLTLCLAGIPYLYCSVVPSRFTSLYVKTGVAVGIGVLLFGGVRLSNPTEYTNKVVRLVQPSISQSPFWELEEQRLNLNLLLRLSQVGSRLADIVIWPETALGFYLEGDALKERLGRAVPEGSHLIFGVVKRDKENKKIWNSLYVLNHQGQIEATYDKHHLVPFGEYVPFRRGLEVFFPKNTIRKVTSGMLDFSEGAGPQTLHVSGIPSFAPAICYEAIFPGQVTSPHDRPEWLLHLTNDIWFGTSFGPYQHFQIARMRAIEEGIPVVRVANSGISGVIDPYGRIIKETTLGTLAVEDVRLPKALPTPPLCRLFFSIMAWFDRFDPFSSRKY